MSLEQYEAIYRYYATRAAQVARGVVLKTDAFNESGRRWWAVPIVDKLESTHVVVVEIDGARAAICREKYPEVEVICADLSEVEFQARTFDTILDLSTLDHIASWEKVLESYQVWLSPGGSLLLFVWLGENFVSLGVRGSDYECILPEKEVKEKLAELFNVVSSGVVMSEDGRDLTEFLCEAR
jgi:SAM-dependent methyltransferase